MDKYEDLECKLFVSKFDSPDVGNFRKLWESIREDKDLLRWAIQVRKDMAGRKNVVNGIAICDAMLANYDAVDPLVYDELIQTVYSDVDVARLCAVYPFSYLLMSFWNPNLKLSELQKSFAVHEAMNQNEEKLCQHGSGAFDLRYCILRNLNWFVDEKEKLIPKFWEQKEYDSCLQEWESAIVADCDNFFEGFNYFNENYMYKYTYNELFHFYQNKETVDRVCNEINFCKMMHQLRPKEWNNDKLKVFKKDK